MLRFISALACAAALSAITFPAAAALEGRAIATLKPTRETDIRALLADVEIGPECCDAAEEFYSDGYYVRLGYSAMPGTWTVASNRVCATRTEDHHKTCHYFYSDGQDVVYMAAPGEAVAYLLIPRPLSADRIARHVERMKAKH